jgi:hypothetical protein
MTTQFPDFYGSPALPTEAVPDERAEPVPTPAPSSYTTGTPQGFTPVIQPDAVARALRLPSALDTGDLETITDAIMSAQSDVEAYLGRPVVPLTYTEYCRMPGRLGWRLKNYPVQSIVTAVAETDTGGNPTGTYTVTYVAGLDAVTDPELFPIARFIKLHAMYDPMVQVVFRQLRPDIATRVTSGSTEGQSATITDALPVPASARTSTPASVNAQMSLPGSAPTLQTLDRWRIGKRRVYQRPTRLGDAAPWPYGMPLPGTGDFWWGRWETWW